LVPDEVTLKVVKDRLSKPDCKSGVLFDGFPRTIPQAIELDKFFKVDAVIYLEVELDVLIGRAENRLVCPSCKKIFIKSEYNKDSCDTCGTKLVKRKDDEKETVIKRYNEFKSLTLPLFDYYNKQHKLYTLAGEGSIDDVYVKVNKVLKSVMK
jgi:adenylate kinase